VIKKTIKLKGLHCTSCALLIEGELEDIGVKAVCNWAKGTVDVEFDPDRINDTHIKEAVERAGYSVGE